jgi:polar amino acid transport system substrate-binding protein
MTPKLGLTVAALAVVTGLTAAGCITVGSATTAGPGGSPTESGETVRVAIFNNYPPAEYVRDGRLTGWMIEMLDPLARESGLAFEIVQINNFSTLIPGLQSGRFDLAAANLTVSGERTEVIDMVTVDSVGTGFSTAKGGGVEIRSGLDVCGKEVSALSGSVYEPQLKAINAECATAGLPVAKTNLYPDSSAAILAAANGRVDVFMGSYAEIVYSADESGQLVVQPYQFAKLPEAIGFPKGSPYTQRVRAAMATLIANGEYAAILEKWGMAEIAITEPELNPLVD